MGLKAFIKRRFTKEEEINYTPNDLQCLQRFVEDLKNQTQCTAISNDSVHEQNLLLFVCKLGDDAFPFTFPLITDGLDNIIKGLIAIYPLEVEGVNCVKLALDGIIHAHSSFDFIITIDTQKLQQKQTRTSVQTIFRHTNEIAAALAKYLSEGISIESILKIHSDRFDFKELMDYRILSIIQRHDDTYPIKNRLVVGCGRVGAKIAEEVYCPQSIRQVLRLGLLHDKGESPYLDLLGIGGNVGVGFDNRPQFYKKIVTTNSKTIQKCLIKMLIGTKLPLSTLTEEIIPYIAYNGH